MQEDVAWQMIHAAFRSTRPLGDLIPVLKDKCEVAEYAERGKAVATQSLPCTSTCCILRLRPTRT